MDIIILAVNVTPHFFMQNKSRRVFELWIESEVVGFFLFFLNIPIMGSSVLKPPTGARNRRKDTVKIQRNSQLRILPMI